MHGDPESDAFLRAVDTRIQAFVDLGAVVGCVADHGMSRKTADSGQANVIFLQDRLEAEFGKGSARVICPITDPFVRHHGALGSFVRVYAQDAADVPAMIAFSQALPGVKTVLARQEAAEQLELPADREGDFLAVSEHDHVIGSRADEHDLSNLGRHPLRSHGGFRNRRCRSWCRIR